MGPDRANQKAPGRARGSLNRDVILDAAVTLVDEVGLPGFSMRRLGAALGIDAMTIYGYFTDKAALVDAMVDREAQRLRQGIVFHSDDPLEMLIAIACNYRRVLLEHPGLAPAVAARPFRTDTWTEQVGIGLGLLSAAGIPDDDLPLAAEAVANFTMGFITYEARLATQWTEIGEGSDARRARLVERMASLPEGSSERAALARFIASLDGEDTGAETFERGLRALLLGLRHRTDR